MAEASTLGVPGRRGEILHSAMQVFGERGYDGGSMREIAERVGVSEPALYRHFPSKAEMFLELIEAVATKLHAETFSLLEALHAETLRDQAIAAMRDRRRAFHLYAPMLRAILTATAADPRVLETYRDRVVLPMRSRLTATAERLDAEFGLTEGADDRDVRVRTLMSLLVGTFVSSAVLEDDPDEAAADALIRLMRWEQPPESR